MPRFILPDDGVRQNWCSNDHPAGAVGDDRIQPQTQGYVVPDAFTHGTSEQLVRRFKKGLDTGDINQGDTFGADIP